MLEQDTTFSADLAPDTKALSEVSSNAPSDPHALKVRVLLAVVVLGLVGAASGALFTSRTSELGAAVDIRSAGTSKTHALARAQGLGGQTHLRALSLAQGKPPGIALEQPSPTTSDQPTSSSLRALEPIPEVMHTVHTGGTLRVVGDLYQIPEQDLIALNPTISPEQELRPGQKVRIYSKDHVYSDLDTIKRSKEHLAQGVPISDGLGRTIRRRSRSWGTLRTVRSLDTALNAYGRAFPDGPPIIVSDLSRRAGGRLRPHHGHREGRDADLSYVPKPRHDNGGFLMMNKRVFDVERNWTFYKALLDTGNVHKVLMDTSLQKLLFEHARDQGVPVTELRRIFQYPRPETKKVGIIQHWAKHRDHVHIRFKP